MRLVFYNISKKKTTKNLKMLLNCARYSQKEPYPALRKVRAAEPPAHRGGRSARPVCPHLGTHARAP